MTGTLVSQRRYLPYGATRPDFAASAFPTDRRFTGQREEVTLGVYDYGARFYSPGLGRFLSADTLVPEAGRPQSLNRYSYARGNPLRYIDPSGHMYQPALYDGAGGPWINTLPYQGVNGAALKQNQSATEILSNADNAVTALEITENVFRTIRIGTSNLVIAPCTGPQYVTRGGAFVGPGIKALRIYGFSSARQAAGVGDLSFVAGEAAIAGLPGGGGSVARGAQAAGGAVKSVGTGLSLAVAWGVDIYDYTWGDHAGASGTELAAAMTVDTGAILASTAGGAFAGGLIGGPVGAPLGAAIGGIGYLSFNYTLRDWAVQWTDANIIIPVYNSWLAAPNPNLGAGYFYH